jgi:hypothetical protein
LLRGLRGSSESKDRALNIAISALRYGHVLLGTEEQEWLNQSTDD